MIAKPMNINLNAFLTMVKEMQDVSHGLLSARIKSILQVTPRETWYEEVTLGDTSDEIAGRMLNPSQLGVCYLRDDGSEHRVVYRNGTFIGYRQSDTLAVGRWG